MRVRILRGVVSLGGKLKPGDIYDGPDAWKLAAAGRAEPIDDEPEEKPEVAEDDAAEYSTSSGRKLKSGKKGIKVGKRGA